MALATSTVTEYRQDPKFMQDLEIRQRESLVATMLFNTEFLPELKKGRQIKVNREFKLDAASTDAVSSITYDTLNTDEDQTFTVDSAFQIPVRIFDVDEIQTVFDLHNQVMDTGMFAANQYLDKQAFSKLYSNSFGVQDSVDISGSGSDASKGNSLYAALMDVNRRFDAAGFEQMDRKTVLDPYFMRYLRDADKLTGATETAERRMTNGYVDTVDGVDLYKSINVYKTSSEYTLTAKGNITVGSIGGANGTTITVDDGGGAALTEPQVGDTFTNNSKTFTIWEVKKVTSLEYQLLLDRPIETQINDNASITMTGYHTAYIPVVQGRPGQGVIQKFPNFEALRDPSYHATLVRLLSVYDFFLSNESSRRVTHIPVQYRSTTGGTWS